VVIGGYGGGNSVEIVTDKTVRTHLMGVQTVDFYGSVPESILRLPLAAISITIR
jgi:hypothetical protein